MSGPFREPAEGTRRAPRTREGTIRVVALAALASIVICCVAISYAPESKVPSDNYRAQQVNALLERAEACEAHLRRVRKAEAHRACIDARGQWDEGNGECDARGPGMVR